MPKREAGALFLPLNLDPGGELPLYRQLYDAIRHAILSGQLAAGTRLPSTRALARTLGIARTTVVIAFEQLLAEGYVVGQQGSGTYVAAVLPEDTIISPSPDRKQTEKQSTRPASLEQLPAVEADQPVHRIVRRGQLPPAPTSATITPSVVRLRAFAYGQPDLSQFPFKIWARLSAQHWRNPPRELLGYTESAIYGPLRAEIATYLRAVRAVRCEPGQVIVVAGAQQAIALAAQILLDPGDAAWIEDPCYASAYRTLLGAGARVEPVPVDQEGLNIAVGIERCPDARLVYVTPSHQYPLGVTMSLARRLHLLQWASRNGAWILEDDYDCEYRYAGRPLSSLQGLDENGQVIYIGTFSKVLFPGLRMGYLVVPPNLVDAFTAARAAPPAMHEQLVLTDFLREGHFARHVRHMRKLYAERQHALVDAVRAELAGLLDVAPTETGMHLVARLAQGINDYEAFKQAAKYHVAALPLSLYRIRATLPDALLLGYTAVTPEEIRQGVKQLARALEHISLTTHSAQTASRHRDRRPGAWL